jgi:hypothetical protein
MKNSESLKNEVKEMLEETSDINILQTIKNLLENSSNEYAIKQRFIEMAEKSELDIISGKVFSSNEAIKYLNRGK